MNFKPVSIAYICYSTYYKRWMVIENSKVNGTWSAIACLYETLEQVRKYHRHLPVINF